MAMAAPTELHHLTIGEAAPLIAAGELSPVELTRAYLARIDAIDGKLNAFVTLTPELALSQARQAEAEIHAGRYRGPLHGIPIGLKDLYDTAGIKTTAMSRVTPDRVPDEDATTVAKLYEAGAVLLGKLAMHEFALGGPDFTSLFPPARNPWNTAHMPRRQRAAAPGRRSPPACAWARWGRTRAAASGGRPPCAASPASSQLSAESATSA